MGARILAMAAVLCAAACAEPQRTLVTDAGDDALAADAMAGACQRDPQCDDRIACTVDHCREGRCTHEPCRDCCPSGTECLEESGCGRARRACTRDDECADGVRCTLDRCRDGRVCENVPQEGLCGAGEVCLAALGCIPRPPDRCATDADCNARRCLGAWTCAPELGCQFRAPLRCDDDDACTVDSCDDARGCRHAPRDADNDRHGDRACGGDDCDDRDPARSPSASEACGNNVDDDCDGMTDEGCGACTPGTTRPCYTGPAATLSVGRCRGGTQVCRPDRAWDATCVGEAVPATAEVCGNSIDDDCDGMTDEACGECAPGTTRPCYTGAAGTQGAGVCRAGTQVCGPDRMWQSQCVGEVRPAAEVCGNGVDEDCNGAIDNGCASCPLGATRPCYSGPAGTGTMGRCRPGTQTCGPTSWGPCAGEVLPAAEACGNLVDDDCDGAVDEGCCVAGGACTTTCGSRGTTACMGATATCAPPAEACNGRDDDCDGMTDEGFACTAGATGSCPTSCGSTGRRTCLATCAWDTCAPPAETCNGFDDNCNGACDETFTCCARATRDCSALGFVSGTATCRADCGGWDTSGCSNCGNGRRDAGEQCDRADLGGATCASLGLGAGTPRCAANCQFDLSGCSSCGNGRIDAGEQCDGAMLGGATCTSLGMGFSGGTLRCGAGCRYDTAMCAAAFDPTGTWRFSPGAMHTCAFGLVNITFGALNFNDTGSVLNVSGGGMGCVMTGASARATRRVSVTCTVPGSCAEVYTLTGMFTSDAAFTGTFTTAFVGGATACLNCTGRSFTVSATR